MQEKVVTETKQNLDTLFASYKDRFGAAELEACLATRDATEPKPQIIGKPVFEPNYFLSCAVSTAANVHSLSLFYEADSPHTLIFKVTAPVKNPPPEKQIMNAVGAKTHWAFQTHCAYRVTGDKIEAFGDRKFGIFFTVSALPTRVRKDSPCLDMPNAYDYVKRR